MTQQALAPVAPWNRLETLDLLRGFALCGILLMNITFMGLDRLRPALPAVLWSPDWTIWFVRSVALEGTMRGLFTLLFGAGVLLMIRRHGGDAADVYFRRCLMLIALGLANVVVFLFPGDILFYYGLTGLFLFVFRNVRPRTLLIVAGVIVLALSAKSVADFRPQALEMREAHVLADAQAAGRTLTDDEKEKAKKWAAAVDQTRRPPAALKMREQRTGGWLSVLGWSLGWWDTILDGYLFDFIAECAAFMLVGMALFKLGVTTGERSLRVYVLMAAGGYAVGLPLNFWEAVTAWNEGFAPGNWIIYSTYQIDRLAMTIGHLGFFLLLWRAGALRWIEPALRAIGRLGLTNYLGQSLLAAVFFYGFGMWDRLSWPQLWGVCVVVWLIQAVFSLLYLRRFAIGPAEWLLRTVAYGKRQPLRVGVSDSQSTR